MTVNNFVSGSALVLAAWLGATFLMHEATPQDDPSPRRASAVKDSLAPATSKAADRPEITATSEN